MTAVTIIVDLVLILVSIVLILTVLMQQGQRQGLGAIGGGAETFFGKNKAKSYEGKLAKLTKVCAIIFIVLALVATIVSGTGNEDSAVVNADNADEEGFVEINTDTVETEDADTSVETEEIEVETEETPVDEATEETADDSTEETTEGDAE